MDLVTVTCFDDRHQMLLQAESIEKFLEPCTHWVIVNDLDVDRSFWNNLLSPFYKNHTLKLFFPEWNTFPNGTGYEKQQCYKFWVSKLIAGNYLVLDSKNFFIRPSKLSDWNGIIGSGKWQIFSDTLHDGWTPTFKRYQKKLGIESNATQLAIQTPFLVDRNILNQFGDLDQFLTWFNHQDDIRHSEFLYYSLIAEKNGFFENRQIHNFEMYFTLWKNESTDILKFTEKIDNSPNIKVLGLHRFYLSRLDSENLSNLRYWLQNKGFRRLSIR